MTRAKDRGARRGGREAWSVLLALAVGVAPAACGDDDDGNGRDAGRDATGMDAGTDDAGPAEDAASDGEVDDAGVDAGEALALDLHLPPSGTLLSYGGGLTLLPVELHASAGVTVELSVATEAGLTGEVVPEQRVGRGVFELFLRPAASTIGETLPFEVRATTASGQTSAAGVLEVIEWSDEDTSHADELLALFLPTVAETHPELGLGPDTAWIESWNSNPVLVVTHRSYLSEGYEVHVAWHNTMVPHDWAYLTVRPRSELLPSLGWCIPSQVEDHTVQEADLSDPRLPCAR